MQTFSSILDRFNSSLKKIISHNIDIKDINSNIIDFKEKKKSYYISLYKSSLKELLSFPSRSVLEEKNKTTLEKIAAILSKLKTETNLEKIQQLTSSLKVLDDSLIYPKENFSSFNIKNLPSEIQDEMTADLKELEKCFASDAYRASVILCGRLLETALHRVYFQKTNNDLLEKSPGIGLGNLIAKIKDKGINLDPALTQQVHLINQVRIYSVHKKSQSFSPTKDQTNAIILYTVDVIRKLFE